MPTITLYQFEDCPYCEKVRGVLKEKGLKYDKVNVIRDRNDPLRQELAKKSGVPTVPVIKIDSRYIGDSQRIVDYLEDSF